MFRYNIKDIYLFGGKFVVVFFCVVGLCLGVQQKVQGRFFIVYCCEVCIVMSFNSYVIGVVLDVFVRIKCYIEFGRKLCIFQDKVTVFYQCF